MPLGTVHLLEPLDDVDGHADRARLVRQRARDRLADPPGRVGRELVAAPPVELLDRPDQAQRALLDQVEERQALVAVVLRDRDDQAQVRLDHPLLRLHVAALDLLGELDLLRGGQQRMAPGLAQEELQCVGCRLERRRRGWGSRLAVAARVLDNVDPPLLEHPIDSVDLERGEPVRLEHLEELGRVDGARDLGGLEELDDLLGLDDAVDRGYRCFQHVSGTWVPAPANDSNRFFTKCRASERGSSSATRFRLPSLP